MRLKIAIPENRVSKPVLDAALEATTRLNESLIEAGDVPLFDEVAHRIRWKPEPKGDEHFDHAIDVIKRGWGDCDDQAPYAAASMRMSGEDPEARAVVKRSGPKRWHAVVQRGDGSYRDPSKETGMRPGIAPGVFGASVAGIGGMRGTEVGAYIALPRLAVRPKRNPADASIEAWEARADLPWHWSPGDSPGDIAMASLHASPIASQAIVGALEGAIELAEESGFVDSDTIACGEAMTWVCGGADWEDVADEFGEEIADGAFELVGNLFKRMGKVLKPVRKVLKSKPVRFAAPVLNPAGYAIARGADAALSRKGNIIQKAKGFGGGVARGYQDRFKNPIVKGVAKKFGMSKMVDNLERFTDQAANVLEKGGGVHVPKGVKIRVPKGGLVRQIQAVKKPPGAKVVRVSQRAKPGKFATDQFQKAICYIPRG